MDRSDLCGCGKPGRYIIADGMSCNKHRRCAAPPPPAEQASGDRAADVAAARRERDEAREELEQAQLELAYLAKDMVFNGNSIGWIASKADNYGAALLDAWRAMGAAGFPPDGKTPLHEAIATAFSALSQRPVIRVGAYGSAFDLPNTCRAFTYEHQPGNVLASRLGRATKTAANASAGDSIDRGLCLLKALQDAGFGVYQLAPQQPTGEEG